MRETDDLYPTRRSLLSRLKDWDDQESWRDFFNTYWRLIFTTARRAGLTETEAEDVVQETVLAVTRKMHDFKYDPARGSFKAWLRLLTQRRIADHLRKAGRLVPTVHLAARDDTPTDPLAALADPANLVPDARWEEDYERNLLSAALDRVRGQIEPLTFQVFDYHVMQGQSAAQTARALGISTAKVHLVKLRVSRMLRREVETLREGML